MTGYIGDIAHSELTRKIIGCALEVFHQLGPGFLERVYENALVMELRSKEMDVIQQYPINVSYKGAVVGEYYADILVNNCVILEIKAVSALNDIHQAQLLNYLKACQLEVGLLINFGDDIEWKRKVMSKRRPRTHKEQL